MDPMSDVEVISIDDDNEEEGGGRSDAGLDAEGETSSQDGQDDEDVQIGDSRNDRHQRGLEHQLQREESDDDDIDYNNDGDEDFEPGEEIFSQDPQGLEESKIIESCRRQQQASTAPLLTSEDGEDQYQFGAFRYGGPDPTDEEDELITQRRGRGQTQRCHEQGVLQQPTSMGPLRLPPRPDANDLVDLTLSEPREHRPLRGQRAAASFSGFRSEYDELLERAREDGLGFPFEAVAELLLRHPKHWWCW